MTRALALALVLACLPASGALAQEGGGRFGGGPPREGGDHGGARFGRGEQGGHQGGHWGARHDRRDGRQAHEDDGRDRGSPDGHPGRIERGDHGRGDSDRGPGGDGARWTSRGGGGDRPDGPPPPRGERHADDGPRRDRHHEGGQHDGRRHGGSEGGRRGEGAYGHRQGDPRWRGDHGGQHHGRSDHAYAGRDRDRYAHHDRYAHDDRRLRDRDHGRRHYDARHYRPHYVWPRRYHAGAYVHPHGYRDYVWRYGDYLPWGWYEPHYFIDYWDFGLPRPPIGCEWVRVGWDAVLVDIWTGEIRSVARRVFW